MPQISKVRIVNFKYNKGKRMIADELYDFADSQSEQAFNVLINLENGGGKSVLVQLMMQPIIPKAKVAGRKIESFFDSNSDHCFILLEWFKDNSPEKLLTGISMSASETNGTEDDKERGRSVKYYTFYTNYRMYNSRYDIVNMPLSKKENNRFIAADFDEVRRLSRQSNGLLQYYSSDDGSKWKKKLAEYGLIQDEWRLAETLNSVEGGLSKFFEAFKTSDSLVDRFLLKTIEDKIGQNTSNLGEDTSLSSMLLSYARQYAGKQDVLKEQKELQSFVDNMDELRPHAEKLWTMQDKLQESMRNLYGLSGAITVKLNKLKKDNERIEEQTTKAKETILHIEWEKASKAFYEAEKNFEEAKLNYEEAEKQKNELETEKDRLNHKLDILECAKQNQKLSKITANMTAIQQQISEKQKGSDGTDQLLRYKYSTLVAVNQELATCMNELKKCRSELEDAKKDVQEKSNALDIANKKLQQADSSYKEISGRFHQAMEQTDEQVEQLKEGISRRLDGYYSQDELDGCLSCIENKKLEIEDELRKNKDQMNLFRNKIESIPEKKSNLFVEKAQTEQEIDKCKQDLSTYNDREKDLQNICSQYNLNFSLRFSDYILSYLDKEKCKADVDQNSCFRKLDIVDQEIKAVENGYLHVPRAVIDYLNSTGIQYTTCEKYLLEQVGANQITRERLSEILENYPAAAYGILLKDEEKQKLFAFEREEWLPSMIPLFNYGQIDQILQVQKKFDGSLAFYSKAYFKDTDHYVENLHKKRDNIISQQNILSDRMRLLESQIEQAKAFDYEEKWKTTQESNLDILNQKLMDLEQGINLLENQKLELNQKIKDNEETEKTLNVQLRKIEDSQQLIGQIQKAIQKEKDLGNEMERLHGEYLNAEECVKQTQGAYDNSCKNATYLELNITGLEEQRKKLNKIHDLVSECNETEVIFGVAEELFQTYKTMEESLNLSLKPLNDKLEYLLKKKETCENEIAKKHVQYEEYQEISYSEKEEDTTRSELESVSKMAKDAQDKYHRCGICKGENEALFKTAQNNLGQFGGNALEKSEIGDCFTERENTVKTQISKLESDKKQIDKQYGLLSWTHNSLEENIRDEERPENIPNVILEDDVKQQFHNMKAERVNYENQLSSAKKDVSDKLSSLKYQYHDSTSGVDMAIEGLLQIMNSISGGDRYYTLCEHINGEKENALRAISQNKTDLQEIENQRSDLIQQCTIQGKCMYESLTRMATSSKVTVYDGKPKKQMIQFNIPDEIDPSRANRAISETIDIGVKEVVDKMAMANITEADIRKQAGQIVGSSNLLRCYIGQDSVEVKAYKIDQNPQNAEYRTWEQTQVNNSGAEKFVVYFAVILSAMNYTRGEINGLNDKNLCSALILDNPFGATSSRHILEPMFAIARHFRVQLVCLSDINKAEVINCFDTVIKAIVKRKPASNNELLTHDGNETIEHGFYRSEQISI